MKAKITNHDKLDKIVENLIAKVEDAGSWIKPFKSAIQGGMPINGTTGKEYRGINIGTLQQLADGKGITVFTKEVFVANGLAGKNDLVKILGSGELKVKLEVTADAFSKSAVAAIEAQGGTATKI